MRRITVYIALAGLGAAVFAPLPALALGVQLGPFHIHIPLYLPRRHRLYMRASPGDDARSAAAQGPTAALFYPNLALPAMFQGIFTPNQASSWPFGFQAIWSTAFAKTPPAQNLDICRQPVDTGAIVGRISAAIAPSPDQTQLLQKLGGALGAASGYLGKSCPSQVPAQPTARLQLMQTQVEQLSLALDIVRQPLQDFEQSLDSTQQAQWAAASGGPAAAGNRRPADLALSCDGSPAAIDSSIDQIDQSVQPTDAQRDALNTTVRQTFGKAASDLASHCPTSIAPTALERLGTIESRLDSTWRATLSIQVALTGFESILSDAQRDRLDNVTSTAAR